MCRLRHRDGASRVVHARELVSGRLIEQICRGARAYAFRRHLEEGREGIRACDLERAVWEAWHERVPDPEAHPARRLWSADAVANIEGWREAQGRYVFPTVRELEACEKRKGEATALFLDDVPTYRHLAPLPYWLARAQEGLGQTSAAVENYKKFLALTPAASRDSLVLDARRRLQSLATP